VAGINGRPAVHPRPPDGAGHVLFTRFTARSHHADQRAGSRPTTRVRLPADAHEHVIEDTNSARRVRTLASRLSGGQTARSRTSRRPSASHVLTVGLAGRYRPPGCRVALPRVRRARRSYWSDQGKRWARLELGSARRTAASPPPRVDRSVSRVVVASAGGVKLSAGSFGEAAPPMVMSSTGWGECRRGDNRHNTLGDRS
jgi:hypothetical protein